MALFLGVGADDVRRGLRSFSPIEHRIEPAGEVAGVRYVNDSKATNTDSVEKALTAFDAGTIVLLLGGHDKGTDLTSLAAAVRERCRVAVCFGEAGERIARALEAERGALEVVRAPHLREAFAAQRPPRARARPCSSRRPAPPLTSLPTWPSAGRLFKALVAELAAEGA